jgi:hypothetical protein
MPKEGIVVPFSSETKQGLDKIWEIIDPVVEITE